MNLIIAGSARVASKKMGQAEVGSTCRNLLYNPIARTELVEVRQYKWWPKAFTKLLFQHEPIPEAG